MKSKDIINGVVIAMAVVVIAVISSLIVSSILESSTFDGIDITGTITNESLGAVDNITNITLGIISTDSTATCTIGSVNNATSGGILTSGNYTFYGSDCKLILVSASDYIGETLNATYDYAYDSNRTNSGVNVNNLKTQFGLFITGLLSFLAIIGTILGIVWLVFYVKALFDKKDGLQSLTA